MKTINLCELSNCFTAWTQCNEVWKEKHEIRINEMLELLPHGSGIDEGIKFDWEGSKKDKLIFNFGFHHLNENGYYDGWTNHKLIVIPSFIGGYAMDIKGINRNMVKDYLYDVFSDVFSFEPNYQIVTA